MASELAEKIYEEIERQEGVNAQLAERCVAAADAVLQPVKEALWHARYRNHEHHPESSDGCLTVDRQLDALGAPASRM
ncbi:MAG TPA: hypothetical protein VIW64_16310 [Pyrinomonadaceae bacterium]|jgi:hypothetical protein